MGLRSIGRVLAAVAVLVTVSTGAVWKASGPACACSCMPVSPDEAVTRADAVVEGRAITSTEEGTSRLYLFEVDAVYKAPVERRIVIRTPAQSAACGIDLTIGEQRTVLLSRADLGDDDGEPQAWQASLCSNLNRFDASLPASAGERLAPRPGFSDAAIELMGTDNGAHRALTLSPWMVAGGALVGVVLVVGVPLAVRRRRRTDS